MKTKFFSILMIICSAITFSSCSEEEIKPQDNKLENNTGVGIAKEDNTF